MDRDLPWHINRRGEPGRCRAKQQCPFDEHYATPEEARGAFERLQSGEAPTSPLSSADLAAGRPTISLDDVAWGKTYRLEKGAKQETKNRGEYSEFYATLHLLSSEKPAFAPGSEPFTVESLRVGGREFVVAKTADSHGVLVRGLGERAAAYIPDPAVHLEAIKADITGGKTATFKSRAVQSACVNLGFTSGRVPKAASTFKADLVAWDDGGREHRISVKSFMGSAPSLINASQQSELRYSAALPKGVTAEELEETLSDPAVSTKEKVAFLRSKGVVFDPTRGEAVAGKFKKNLAKVHPLAQQAYCAAAFEAADSSSRVPEELQEAYHHTLHAFASRMTHSTMEPESQAVTDFLSVGKRGTITVVNFPTPAEAGAYFAERVRFQEPSKERHSTGEFTVANGKVFFKLNAFASLSEGKRKRR